mmetsp:Transcript_13837/g.41080  ORF Transcript_13837/g.41080 Transcript_13837/m.41080 type:complete len:145 (+) Transcript_13837:1063-1497(+)
MRSPSSARARIIRRRSSSTSPTPTAYSGASASGSRAACARTPWWTWARGRCNPNLTLTPGAHYPWVLEFQCANHPKTGNIIFAGINFYSREATPEAFEAMLASAGKHGLGPWMDPLTRLDHSECTYPEGDAEAWAPEAGPSAEA